MAQRADSLCHRSFAKCSRLSSAQRIAIYSGGVYRRWPDPGKLFALLVQAVISSPVMPCRPPAFTVFERAFHDFGLPDAIRTDNGVPFASPHALCGLSKLSVWWLGLGIRLERITPGHPEQNGRHERMHLTLKLEASKPPAANVLQPQGRFDDFVTRYNQERPHQALDMRRTRSDPETGHDQHSGKSSAKVESWMLHSNRTKFAPNESCGALEDVRPTLLGSGS